MPSAPPHRPTDTKAAPGNNPTGMTKEKQKSGQRDPEPGGKKQ
jgi:hypothetical protein